jgi:Flp pilus assembly pilin Flp
VERHPRAGHESAVALCWRRLRRDRIEYGFVALLVSIAAVGAFVALGSSVENLFQRATLGW